MKLTIKRMGKRYWIIGSDEPIGPYDTMAEAHEDRKGLLRFYKFEDKPGYVTSETPALPKD